MISNENNIDRDVLAHAKYEPFSFLCIDKPRNGLSSYAIDENLNGGKSDQGFGFNLTPDGNYGIQNNEKTKKCNRWSNSRRCSYNALTKPNQNKHFEVRWE